jgi:hypothetical protein
MWTPSAGRRKSSGMSELAGGRIDLHGGRAFGRVRGQLQRHPAARVARHGPAVQAVVEVFLQVGRRQHRDAAGGEHVLALVGHGRGARRGVVAGDQQHAAVFRGAGVVGVLEDVAAAVDAGPLAVPHRKDAVEFRLREQVQLLRAPDRGGGDVLVDAGLEADVVLLEEGRRRRAGRSPGRPAASRGSPRCSRRYAGRRAVEACCSMGRRARACMPVRKTVPRSRRYLSSRSGPAPSC